jgi:hypothetical protein
MEWKEKFMEMLFPLDSSKVQMEQAFLLKYGNLPSRIYKYRKVDEYSKQNLREGTVWLADPESLNDPYDCAHLVDHTRMEQELFRSPSKEMMDRFPKEVLESGLLNLMKSSADPKGMFIDAMLASKPEDVRKSAKQALLSAMEEMYEGMARSFIAKIKSAFKLCSFSERVDSTLMWAHYADYHKGFCIEYDIKSLEPDYYVSRFMYPVVYSDRLFDLTEHFVRGVNNPEFNNLFPNQVGLHKASDWEYEKEWRLLFSNGILDKPQAYPMPRPKMVYVGSHITPEHQKDLVEICREINVPIMKMKHSVREYRMLAVTLEEAAKRRFG